MALQQPQSLTPKQQALHDLETARKALARHAALAVREWNPRTVITHSIERHRIAWAVGAALAGLATVRLLLFSGRSNNRRDNLDGSAKNRGFLALLLAPLLAYGRKAALGYGVRLFQSYLQQKVSPNIRPPGAV